MALGGTKDGRNSPCSIQERLRDFIDRKMGQERFKGDLE